MMRFADGARLALAAMAMLTATACGGMRTGGDDVVARIIVDNQHGPLGTVQVWVVPETGIRRLIGNVGSARVDTLTFSVPTSSVAYRLRAEPATGGQLLSRPFHFLAGPTIVRWELGQNVIFVSEP